MVDFTGTSPQLADNFNAPAAVCRAAVLYVFRTLVDEPIPMNEGCLKPIEIVIPEGCMLNPRHPAAVVAGNVETSQCITDALYGALGVLAAAQGTMNNFTFGDDQYQYYETICGGSGAGPGLRRHLRRPHAHDQLAPDRPRGPRVALSGPAREPPDQPRLRRGRPAPRRRRHDQARALSRADERGAALEPPASSRRSASRAARPAPAAGSGSSAQAAAIEPLAGCAKTRVGPGDVFVIQTPGGGGFGAPEARLIAAAQGTLTEIGWQGAPFAARLDLGHTAGEIR